MSTATQKVCLPAFLLSPTSHMRYSLHYTDFLSFTDDKMILQAIAVHDIFIIILSQYIVFINACHTLHDAHLVARIPRYS